MQLIFFACVEWSKEVLDLCVDFKNEGIVAIDLAGDERLANPTHELHIKAFQVRVQVSCIVIRVHLIRSTEGLNFVCQSFL